MFAGAEGGMIRVVAVVIGADMAVEEPEFAVFDQPVGVLEIGLAGSNRLHLGAGENDSGLEFFEQEIVVTRVPVYSGILLPGSGGLAARILLPIGLGLVGSLLGHGTEKKVSQGAGGRSQGKIGSSHHRVIENHHPNFRWPDDPITR